MDAKVQEHGEVTVVHMAGQLNLEKSQFFREVCLKQLAGKKLVFSMEGLKFVGSSGIQTFFKTLHEIQAINPYGVKISGVKPDFLRIFNYTETSGLQIHESIEVAVQSFSVPPITAAPVASVPAPASLNPHSGAQGPGTPA